MERERIKGIIFDMDGVLLYSSPIHERAYLQALDHLPIRTFEYASVAGMRTDEALRIILARNGVPYTPELISSLADSKSRIARNLIASENPIAPRCVDLMARLSRNYKLALASSASEATVSLFLGQNRLKECFASVLHGGDVQRAKPDPEIYVLACRRIAVPSSQCLIIEDAVSGVLAAKAAGATVWGIPTTFTGEELTNAGAHRIIDRLEDMITLLVETQ